MVKNNLDQSMSFSWCASRKMSSAGSTVLPPSPHPLVDLNPCLFHIRMPNFNRETNSPWVCFWILGSVFSWPPFPSLTSFKTICPETSFTGLESERLGWGWCGCSALWWNFCRNCKISPHNLRSVWEVLAGLQGFSVTSQILYSKLITFKFIIYTGYLRDNMFGISTDYLVYHYKIWSQVTETGHWHHLFHHLPSKCV